MRLLFLLAILASAAVAEVTYAADAPPPPLGFFVTSAKHKTGNLGGLAAAD